MALANRRRSRLAERRHATPRCRGRDDRPRRRREADRGSSRTTRVGLVDRAEPRATPQLTDRALDAAMTLRRGAGSDVRPQHGRLGGDLAAFERAHRDGRLITRIYAAVPLASWQRLRDTVAARGTGRRVAAHRRPQGIRRRLARLAHGGDARAVHRRAGGSRVARRRRRADLDAWTAGADTAGPARDRARDRRPRDPQPARHVRARRARERSARPAIPDRARAAHRARRHSALRSARRDPEHAAVSRDRRRPLGRAGDRPRARARRRMRSGRCSTTGRRSPSAATGSSRRRRRSRGSMPP